MEKKIDKWFAIIYVVITFVFVVAISWAVSIKTGSGMFGSEQVPLLFAGFMMGMLAAGLREKD